MNINLLLEEQKKLEYRLLQVNTQIRKEIKKYHNIPIIDLKKIHPRLYNIAATYNSRAHFLSEEYRYIMGQEMDEIFKRLFGGIEEESVEQPVSINNFIDRVSGGLSRIGTPTDGTPTEIIEESLK
jgi:hypothetical protein